MGPIGLFPNNVDTFCTNIRFILSTGINKSIKPTIFDELVVELDSIKVTAESAGLIFVLVVQFHLEIKSEPGRSEELC